MIDKIDMLLKENTFDTRAGLRFMGELVKDLFKFIEEEREKHGRDTEALSSFEFRLKNMETGLHDWMEIRKRDAEKAEDERKFYRRTVIGGIIMILIGQLFPFLASLFVR
jgi:hypothetical protein